MALQAEGVKYQAVNKIKGRGMGPRPTKESPPQQLGDPMMRSILCPLVYIKRESRMHGCAPVELREARGLRELTFATRVVAMTSRVTFRATVATARARVAIAATSWAIVSEVHGFQGWGPSVRWWETQTNRQTCTHVRTHTNRALYFGHSSHPAKWVVCKR